MNKTLTCLILTLTINHAFAQITADQCPKSVMIGNDTYDMAGDIRTMGSAQAVLSKINETIQRELPAMCSGPRSRSRPGQIEDMLIRNDQRSCETARTRLMGMKAAVEACIASVNARPKAPPPGNSTPSASALQGASPPQAWRAVSTAVFSTPKITRTATRFSERWPLPARLSFPRTLSTITRGNPVRISQNPWCGPTVAD